MHTYEYEERVVADEKEGEVGGRAAAADLQEEGRSTTTSVSAAAASRGQLEAPVKNACGGRGGQHQAEEHPVRRTQSRRGRRWRRRRVLRLRHRRLVWWWRLLRLSTEQRR